MQYFLFCVILLQQWLHERASLLHHRTLPFVPYAFDQLYLT